MRTSVDIAVYDLTSPFQFAHDTIQTVDIIRLRLESPDGGGEVGLGEIAADAGYGQDSAAIAKEATEWAGVLVDDPRHDDPARLKSLMDGAGDDLSGPARMLVEMAFLDYAARRASLPVWRLLALPEPGRIRLLRTVPFGTDIATSDRPLKIKLGGSDDVGILRRLRGVPGPIILDVNRGWDRREWERLRPLVETVAPAVLEDPIDDEEMLSEIRAALPGTAVILDENVNTTRDIERAASVAGGANIKATRVGGLFPAVDALRDLTERGATRMLGSFLEPRRAIAYTAQLAGMCDWTDLDGHFWVTDDTPVMSYRLDSSNPGIPRIEY